jgi:predicted amidohydrolase
MLEGYRSLGIESAALEILEGVPGEPGSWVMRGGSAVIAPDTSYVIGPVYEETCTLSATLELDRIAEGHLALDTEGHYARPDVFHLHVDDRPQPRVSFSSESPGPSSTFDGGELEG